MRLVLGKEIFALICHDKCLAAYHDDIATLLLIAVEINITNNGVIVRASRDIRYGARMICNPATKHTVRVGNIKHLHNLELLVRPRLREFQARAYDFPKPSSDLIIVPTFHERYS